MKFKNYIETESGIKDTSTSPGTAGQLLSSTVAGTSWIDQNTISSGSSEVVDIQVKNIASADGGVNLSKGDPVYIYGSVGASARLYVDLADADSTATNNLGDSKMPCVALLDQDLSPNGEGTATVVGKLRNLITNPIDGSVPDENDTVYVKPGGGLTLAKPAGSTNLIQNVGQVGRVSTSADGNIVVAALLRTNDVPNLPEGRLFVGTSDNTSLTSDVVYIDEPDGRVGIGTTSPLSAIQIGDGTAASPSTNQIIVLSNTATTGGSSNLYLATGASGTSTIGVGSTQFSPTNTAGKIIYSDIVDTFSFNTNFSTKMVINGSGDVGIGETNPGAKLEVVGSTGVIIDSGSSSAAKLTLIGDGSPFGGGASIDVIGGSNDYLSYILNIKRSPSTLEASNSYFQYNAGWEWNGNQSNSRAQPYTSYSFRSQGSSQMVIYNNNLGIGVTTPSQKLHVNGSARVTGAYYDSSNSPGAANSVLISTISGTVWGARGPLGSGTTNYLARWTPDANTLGIGVTYDNGTNVGIGTTSPDAKLEVSSSSGGVLRLTSSDTSVATGESIGRVEFKSNDASTGGNNVMGFVDCLATNAGSTYALTFGTGNAAAATEKMRINQSGNVGIGTTSLTTISSTSRTLSLGSTSTTTSGGIAFQANSVVKAYNYVANNYLINQTVSGIGQIFYGAGSEQMRIHNTTGNVGIGATNPGAKLEVVGTTGVIIDSGTSTQALLTLKGDASTYGGGGQINIIGGSYDYLYYATNIMRSPGTLEAREKYEMYSHTWTWDGNMGSTAAQPYTSYDFKSQGSSQMVIYNNNVGIGTTNPGAKLDVVQSTASNSLPALHLIGPNTNTGLTSSVLIIEQGDGKKITIDGNDIDVSSGDLFINDYSKKDVTFGGQIKVTGGGVGGDSYFANGNVGIGTTSPGTGAPAGTKLHVVGGIHSSTFVNAVNGLGIYSTSMSSGRGLSLYGEAQLYPQYGMLFATTSDLGTHGSVTADFATYMTMTGANRGWVWKSGSVNSTSGNVASINVSGALTLNSTATATNFILSSDETLKDNIKEIDVKHTDVDWKNFELKSEPGIKRAGVIAQELEIKHPEFVRTADDGLKSVAYIDLLITKIAELEARLEKLEK